ncbi:MAG TPA: DnaB-like helicase C-terminal domain-containing protein [Candidatus Rifleibacterium sp.]|nr:DnaB-like helicase C-terminal domain-containing protein [Candidatus Rifleibacterium sp.]
MTPENRRALEECLVGAAIIRGSFADIDLSPKEFKLDQARHLVKAGRELEAEGRAIDFVTLSAHAGKENLPVSEISRISNTVPTSKNLQHYLEELKKAIYAERATLAKQKAAQAIREADDPEPVARALTIELDALAARYLPAKNNDRFQQVCFDILAKIEAGNPIEGFFKCGIETIDRILAGFCPPEYTVIAARPSVGKTALVINLLHALAVAKVPSCFFSLEMSGNPVATRLLAKISGVNTKLVLRAPDKIEAGDKREMLKRSAELLDAASMVSLYDQPGQTIATICQQARKEVRERGAKILIVDHIQHCKGFGKDRRTEVENISSTFQDLLKELNVPGIMLSQISRKIEGENRRPVMSDLKESGAIEQNADNVLFLHKPANADRPNGYQVEMILAKGRNKGTDFGQMFFNTHKQTFFEVQE